MKKPSIWKWLILIGLVAWSLAVVLPLEEKVNLGIDLKGGTSFVLQVDTSELTDDEIRDAPERALEVIRNRVDALGGTEPIIYLEPKTRRIVVQIPGLNVDNIERTRNNLQRAAFLEFKLVHSNNTALVNEFLEAGEAPPGYVVVESGDARFLQEDRSTVPEGMTDSDLVKLRRTFNAPPNHELMLIKEERGGQTIFRPTFVDRRRQLTGRELVNAGVQQDFSKLVPSYVVSLEFGGEGKKRFANVTKAYSPYGERNPNPQGRQLAIILDGRIYSAPELRVPIYNGRAQIEGNFSFADAQDLGLVLRAGSLPAPVEIIEQRTIAPTLGQDSIDSSMRAIMLGGIAVLVFMLVYYMLAGVIADLALGLDMLLLPLGMMIAAGFLGLFTGSGTWSGQIGLPTLTLAGIAGIVLTIGMAVDANVLIFERIREEQASGKRYRSAVDAGYDKVFSTILDANVTTLLTAVILFWQGSGPIRGFAITLSAGIIVSLYVALVVTRMMFDLLGAYTEISKIRMLSVIRNAKVNFLGMRKVAAVFSLLVILGSWGMFINRGDENFGVDFTGGTAITYKVNAENGAEAQVIRDTLADRGIQARLQFQRELVGDEDGSPKEYLVIKVADDGAALEPAVEEAFGESLEYVQKDSVGAEVSRELQKKGIMSIVWALVGIVIYITWRFEFGFAMGAIVALLHDVLVTVGVFCLLGNQLSLPIIAALLTIVGYSVNDTIVVFDRIREDIGLHKGRPYMEVANQSINRTLARTMLTSVTTLLTVVMLLVFGGGAIHEFALALFIGILVGTYSSIFVATPVTLFWHRGGVPSAAADEKPSKKGK